MKQHIKEAIEKGAVTVKVLPFNKLSDIQKLPVELASTTNPSFQHLVGVHGKLTYAGEVLWFETPGRSPFHTSYIKEIEVHGNLLKAVTRNSVYVFNLSDLIEQNHIKVNRDELEVQVKEMEKLYV